jgi:hypothetical protein
MGCLGEVILKNVIHWISLKPFHGESSTNNLGHIMKYGVAIVQNIEINATHSREFHLKANQNASAANTSSSNSIPSMFLSERLLKILQ